MTIELVPSRMTWPSDGRDPLSMATPSRASRLEITCDPYAAEQPFLETVAWSPVDDVLQEVKPGGGVKRTGRRCLDGCNVNAVSRETGGIPGEP